MKYFNRVKKIEGRAGLFGFFRLLLTLVLGWSSHIVLAETKSLCVFDLLGANGPIYAQMKDYKIAALDWGVDFQLRPYTSENNAAADFRTGLCDAVSFTGIQSRQFNRFSGSLDAIDALPSYAHLKIVITTLSSEQAAPLMINEPYEVVGIIPLGAAYLFVNDRSLVSDHADKVSELAGIRVAVMGSDPAQIEIVGLIGSSSSVGASIAEMYSKFNAGLVDVTYGPAVVYEAMELHKGLQTHGGIIDFPLAQLTLQIMIRRTEFPEKFGQKSREFTLSQFDKAVMLAKNHEARIARKWWISIPAHDQARYHEIFRQARTSLRDQGVYDRKMLALMRLVRCKQEPQQSECKTDDKD